MKCPVYGCKNVKRKNGDVCASCQKKWDEAVAVLIGKKAKP